ncbi:MAG: hypothetical protein GY856_19580 [bacterium]|nr:hypothetical protein [bacterium]
MKVLVVPEDPTYDQYILKPIVERIFRDLDRSVRVQVLRNPHLRGVTQALDSVVLADIVENHEMIKLFLVLVDRDGDAERRPARARALENAHPGRLVVCLAIEEVEVWMLAIHREKLSAPWSKVRSEHHPKEHFADPFLAEHAPKLGPGAGRKWAMRRLGSEWQGVLSVCPELVELKQRIRSCLDQDTHRDL